ncbi:MobF family relaxase, partial [Frankia sp. Cj3]|uniref:MobF family relaxase n=1 Tax=Frankia sp. Cj3 TaxID=2880976 RepID=UPI001EF508A6
DVRTTLTLAEAARIAGVAPSYLRRLAERGITTGADADRRISQGPSPEAVDDATGSETPALGTEPTGEAGQIGHSPQARLTAHKDPSGRWFVERDELVRFMAERDPPTVVMGFDITCAAPKSVSLLWAFGDDDLRRDVAAALNAGVDAALGYLERYATVGMVDGRNRAGLGLAVASYLHDTSRANEAHLHVHNIVANAVAIPVLDDNGQPERDATGTARVEWRALDSEVLLAHRVSAGYVGAAALRHELSRRRGLEWQTVRNGVAELAGFPPTLLEAFSSRHAEVQREFAQLVADGLAPDARTEVAAQRGSRAPKTVLADAQVRAVQATKLTEAGWTVEQIRALGIHRQRSFEPPTDDEISALVDRLVGHNGLTANHPTFTLRDVHQQVAAWGVDRLDPTAISTISEQMLADPRVVLVDDTAARRRRLPELIFTTAELLEIEDKLISLYRQGRADHAGHDHRLLAADVLERALIRLAASPAIQASAAASDPRLDDEQLDLVRQVVGSADLIRPVIGEAGTGKTTAIRTAVRILTGAGYQVFGTAHGGKQAEDLSDDLGVPARVVAGWLTLLDHADDPGQVWTPGTVVVLDEATQVATRDAERLAHYAARTGTVLILLGDPAQLGSVGAGGWYAHLVTAFPDAVGRLTTVRRQRGPAMAEVRAALHGLRSALPDDVERSLRRLANDRRIDVFDDRETMLAAVVDDWYADRTAAARPTTDGRSATDRTRSASPSATGGNRRRRRDRTAARALMMAEHHRDVETLNQAARTRLATDGTLTGPVLHAAGRPFQVCDDVITLTQAGHTLVPHGQRSSDYVRTGTIGTVTAVHVDPAHPERQMLDVRFPGKGTVSVDWIYLTHQFPDGRTGGLGHAYALTAHKAQGADMATARPVVVDDTSRAGLYVMLSRAQDDLRAYLIRRPELEANLDDEDWLPILPPQGETIDRLADRLRRSRAERPAGDIDPHAHAAHRLRQDHTLAELTALRRDASAPTTDRELSRVDPVVLRRAELAGEAAVSAAARTNPPARLIARIGPRPPIGPDRLIWDEAVAALAIYHARHQPGSPPHDPGPEPPMDTDDPIVRWQDLHEQAVGIAAAWAMRLPPPVARRFHSAAERVPRERAIAGIHALLDTGRHPDTVAAQLAAGDQESVRTGAAILENRAHTLCTAAGVHPAAYQLRPPRTARQDWARVTQLLDAAVTTRLSHLPTSTLLTERNRLAEILAATSTTDAATTDAARETRRRVADRARATASRLAIAVQALDDAEQHLRRTESDRRSRGQTAALHAARKRLDQLRRTHAEAEQALEDTQTEHDAVGLSAPTLVEAQATVASRLRRVGAAQARQIDQAVVRLVAEPAHYLTDLLGRPPRHLGDDADTWLRRARDIEDYRHHVLGLPYGAPAAPVDSSPRARAVGPAPADPSQRRRYEEIIQDPSSLGLCL